MYIFIYILCRWSAYMRCRNVLYIDSRGGSQPGLYKMLFCLWACVHESILFSAHPPLVEAPDLPIIAHTIAQYHVSPPTPRYCNIYHTILAMTISCKGQFSTWPPTRLTETCSLGVTRYCQYQYQSCMLNEQDGGGAGVKHTLRNIDYKTQRGQLKEVVVAENGID